MFGWLYRFGLIPRTSYALAVATKPEAAYAYTEANKVVALDPPRAAAFTPAGRAPSPLDLHHKTRKFDDYERQTSDPLRHTKLTHSLIPLGLAGLALAWTAAADAPALGVGTLAGKVLTAAAAAVLAAFCALYAAKAAARPQRVAKEWACPLRSNAFVVPPLCLVVLAACVADYGGEWRTLARVLFWAGAPAGLGVGVVLAARLVAERRSMEHVSPAWLLPAMGALVSAALGPALYPAGSPVAEAMWLWMGFGVTGWLLIFALSFQRLVLTVEADDRSRPLVWAWVAAPALAALAVAALTGGGFGALAKLLFFSALSLALVLGCLFVQGYSARGPFDPAFAWAYAFPLEALVVAGVQYSVAVPGAFTVGLAYAGLALASGVAVVLALQTAREAALGRFFVADAKYGPLSQQVLTHEAFRGALPRLLAALEALDPARPAPALAADFARQFRRFAAAHRWHAAHEETVLFKTFDDYFPGVASKYNGDHAADGPKLEAWGALVGELEAGGAAGWAPAVAALRAELPLFSVELLEHLEGEEVELQPIGRKHIPIDVAKDAMRRIFDMTPATAAADFFPWVVSNLPLAGQRVKFVRCWVWAVPERAQQMGVWLALGLDPPTWARLVAQVPEIVPRGAPGWKKYY
jgi:tellurite resistance protein TehA-like permease